MAHFGNCDPETADQEYCIFHKPNKSEEEAREFYNKFVLKFFGYKLPWNNGWVFAGPVDAMGFVFPEIPYENTLGEERFSFEHAVFRDNAVFSSADFSRAAIIESNPFGPTIDAFLSFEYAIFYKLADFSEAKFDIARFLGAQFNHAIFKGTEFEYADFPWSRFKFADFKKARFNKKALFENSQFEEAHFEESRFNEGNFARTRFERAYFSDPILDYPGEIFTVNEGWTEFRVVDFGGAEFKELFFGKVKIIEHVNFDGIVINSRVTFIPLHQLISMETSNIPLEWELLDRDCFKRECWKKWNFENSFIICNSRFCHPQPLAETAKMQRVMYERLGDREKSDSMFVLEMRAKRKIRWLNAKEKRLSEQLKAKTRNFFEWLLGDLPSEYGTDWQKVLLLSVGVVILFGVIYWITLLNPSLGVALILLLTGVGASVWYFQPFDIPYNRIKSILSGIFIGFGLVLVYLYLPISTGILKAPSIIDGNGKPLMTSIQDITWKTALGNLLNALYYSLVTFTTLGYGDMHPTGWLKALSAIEALTGAVFMALIVAVIARKWMR